MRNLFEAGVGFLHNHLINTAPKVINFVVDRDPFGARGWSPDQIVVFNNYQKRLAVDGEVGEKIEALLKEHNESQSAYKWNYSHAPNANEASVGVAKVNGFFKERELKVISDFVTRLILEPYHFKTNIKTHAGDETNYLEYDLKPNPSSTDWNPKQIEMSRPTG